MSCLLVINVIFDNFKARMLQSFIINIVAITIKSSLSKLINETKFKDDIKT